MEKQAIIFVYDGQTASMDVQSMLGTALCQSGVVFENSCKIYTLNEQEIIGALVNKAVCKDIHADSDETPEMHAVCYIGTLFAKDIVTSTVQFSANLSSQYILACLQHNNDKLRNAVKIIALGDIDMVPTSVLRKYNISKAEWKIITEIYKTACQGHIEG